MKRRSWNRSSLACAAKLVEGGTSEASPPPPQCSYGEQILSFEFVYRLLREAGKNTITPFFMVGVYSDKKLLGWGKWKLITSLQSYDTY